MVFWSCISWCSSKRLSYLVSTPLIHLVKYCIAMSTRFGSMSLWFILCSSEQRAVLQFSSAPQSEHIQTCVASSRISHQGQQSSSSATDPHYLPAVKTSFWPFGFTLGTLYSIPVNQGDGFFCDVWFGQPVLSSFSSMQPRPGLWPNVMVPKHMSSDYNVLFSSPIHKHVNLSPSVQEAWHIIILMVLNMIETLCQRTVCPNCLYGCNEVLIGVINFVKKGTNFL